MVLMVCAARGEDKASIEETRREDLAMRAKRYEERMAAKEREDELEAYIGPEWWKD